MTPPTNPKTFPPILITDQNDNGSNPAHHLRVFDDMSHDGSNTYVPFSWGFTIYRAAFGRPRSDERFAAGVDRLERWLRWEVLQSRYDSLGRRADLPGNPDSDISMELAGRMWNEVVEDYLGKGENVCGGSGEGGDGSEDFTPVGRAFIRWADGLGVDGGLSPRNARYQSCLILDDMALDSVLEGLPAETPPVKPRLGVTQESRDLVATKYLGAWVWVLDRETMRAREAGVRRSPDDTRPPWIRIRFGYIFLLWFHRAENNLPEFWWDVCEEDAVKPDRVFWWNRYAKMRNDGRRRRLEATSQVPVE